MNKKKIIIPVLIVLTIIIVVVNSFILLQYLTKPNYQNISISQSQNPPVGKKITHVFLIIMENHNWSDINKTNAPFITTKLLPLGSHATQYYNPPGNHPSEPNYIWLEAGTNFGITNDNPPTINHITSSAHLTTLLSKAGYTWKVYAEGISGNTCPLQSNGLYAPKHVGPLFFSDVTNNNNPSSQTCIKHIRPYTELQTDLKNNTVPNYVLITPNLCDDMHNCSVQTGDAWMSKAVPAIMNSEAYQQNGAIFITWDEGEGGDGPIGMIVLSPFAKKNYANSIHYDHSSYVRTIEEIFDLKPLLGGARNATDLSNFFINTL